jgi:hypothetical protein
MAWRLAKSLETLRGQINIRYPHRSKKSDGTIGDTAHSTRCSRHNPNNHSVVCAFDLTHDPRPGIGPDAHTIARWITSHPHPELEYIISAGQVASRFTNWDWRPYSGTNRHDIHVHFAVGNGSDCEPYPPYDSTQPWNLPWGIILPPVPKPPIEEDEDMKDFMLQAPNRPATLMRGEQLIQLESPKSVTSFTTHGVPIIELTQKDYDGVVERLKEREVRAV